MRESGRRGVVWGVGPHDGKDLKAVIDAIAREPWCSGCAGMFGADNRKVWYRRVANRDK